MSEKNRTPNKCKNTIIIIAHLLPSVNLFQDLKVVADAGIEKSRKLSKNRNGIGSGRTLSAAETWGLTKRKRVHMLILLSNVRREYDVIRYETPNAETIAAIEEVQKLKADPSLGRTYSDVDQMMEELLADE